MGEIQASRPKSTPNVYIFEYPSMNIVHTLRNGTKRGYTAMTFNAAGDQLATVGGDPDYMLTIWNWETEKIILRYKAFGQDVQNVSFSNNLEGVLTTSGMGHIKFWKMSKTFTGLKLKGDIGKFGKIDMSDINGYVEFPDGKVLSGSEHGNLILWEGNLVKVLIQQDENVSCHNGAIDFVTFIDNEIITAGRDGFIKYWSYEEIDLLEASDTNISVYIKPIQECQLLRNETTPLEIVTLVKRQEDNVWIAQDGLGSLWKLEISSREGGARTHQISKLLDYNSGFINDIISAPTQHVSASGSSDGSIRLVDHHKGKSLYNRKFNSDVVKMIWNPEVVDPSRTSITAGFKDGVIRYLSQGETKWQLLYAFKPHKTEIVSFAYSEDGKVFVTASKDELFFFRVPGFEPVGFTSCKTKLGTTINNLIIHDDFIVLSLQDGQIVKLPIPELDKIDNSKTYKFTWDEYIPYNFYQWLKPPPKDNKDEENDSDDDSEKEEEEETPDPPKVPVKSVIFTPDGNMLVSLEKIGGIFRYSGKWWDSEYHKEPEYPFDCLNSFDTVQVCKMNFSHDYSFLIITYTNGKVRLVETDTIGGVKPTHLSAYNLHSFIEGFSTSAVTSYDDSYLISVSSDGGFFVHKIDDKYTQENPELLFQDADDLTTDIISNDHWSIEEARIKNAELEKQRAALQRQSERKNRLENLRQEYQKFLKETDSRESIGFNREDLQIDTRLQDTLSQKLNEKRELARKELAWNKAKVDLQLKKVKDYFFDCLDSERVVLKSFRSGKVVSTFRTRKLREELIHKIEEVHELINEEIEKKRRMEAERMEQDFLEMQRQQQMELTSESEISMPTIQQSMRDTKKLSTTKRRAEENERRKELRQVARKELEQRKPTEEDDPKQAADIRYAEENMGDFKLKTDPNYIVPENQRMTTEKKLRQMILLEESVHTLRMVFNQNLFQLKEMKAKLIEKFLVYSSRIEHINNELRVKEPIVEPAFDPVETPELRYQVTDEELESFKKQKEFEEKKRLAAESGKFLANDDVDTKSGPGSIHSHQSKRSHGKSTRGSKEAKGRILQSIPISDMERMEEQIKKHTLLYEKERLLRRMKSQIDLFDQKVEELRREKFKLEADLKSSELRLILLYKELELLKEFEKKDSDNYSQLESKRIERDEIVAKIQNCQDRLAEKKEEISQLVQEQKLGNEFMELVPESHPAHQQLFQVYKKSKKNKKQDSDSESDSESDDSESEEEDEEDEENTTGTIEKKPENIDCTEELWQQVVTLRNKRIEQEKLLDTIAKGVEILKKEREGLIKQQKVVHHALKKIEEQIKSVQKEKQFKLNELSTVVILKFSQIQGLLQNKIPKDLTDYIIFTNSGLNNLAVRINDLKKENKSLHHSYIHHQRRVSQLQKEQKVCEDELEASSKKVLEVQHLKFGQLVDLEALENASVDMKAEELKELLSAEESKTEAILKAWDKKINDEKDKLTAATQENTQLLQALSQFRERQQQLENELDESQKTIVNRITKNMTEGLDSKQQLKETVVSQAREIEIAKNEIAILRSKHSHVYRVNDTTR